MNLQKLILPALVLAAAATIYLSYFSPDAGLGSFSSLDPDNHAAKEIIVEHVKEKGVTVNQQSASSVFYVVDGEGTEIMVSGPGSLPEGMDEASSIVLVGHLNRDRSFHAHEVRIND